ncbi:MAG: Rne/Rng family ribonuclease [Myxococcota bacterium]
MAEKLLVNVTVEETRVALVEGGVLSNLEIDTRSLVHAKGNVYKGIVHRVNPSLQAAFVDYGADKQGFLPLSEIHDRYYSAGVRGKRVPIQEVLREGQELMVQVVKDEIGNKGASLTTYVSIPGRYLVLMPDSGKTGLSRRLPGDERKRLKDLIDSLPVPDGFGVIIRTAGVERDELGISQDLEYLKRLWKNLEERFEARKNAGLIHRERDLALRFIRDYATSHIDEVFVDDANVFEEIRDFCTILMPEMRGRIRHYTDATPLFSRYQIEDQIDDVFARRIDLHSGGSIVIEQTEALVSIDVNSGRVKTDDIEKTALTTNLEAASEIARQLKLRDLGGLVVVDFIDMRSRDNVRNVEQSARDAFADDKAKVKFSRISDFGLMEISRQRLKSSIMKGSFEPCSHCGGTGKTRSVESSALYLLRRIKETVIRGTNYMHLSATMPVDVANYVLNRKRPDLIDLQQQTRTTIDIKGTVDCAPNRAFVEILATSGRGKRPRRILMTFDLVRSDVDRRELGDLDEVLVNAAVARGVSLDENEFSRLYRAIEEKMAADAEIVAAQYESERERAVAEAVEATEDAHAKATAAAAQQEEVKPKIGLVGWYNRMMYGDKPPEKKVVEVAALPAPAPARRASSERSERSDRNDRRRGRDRDRGRRGDGRRSKLETNRQEKKAVVPKPPKDIKAKDGDDAPAKKRRRRRRRRRSDGEGGGEGGAEVQNQQGRAAKGEREPAAAGDNAPANADAKGGPEKKAESKSSRRSSGRKSGDGEGRSSSRRGRKSPEGEVKPAAEKKADSTPTGEKQLDSKPAAETKAAAKPAAEKKAAAKPAVEKKTDSKPAAEKKPSSRRPSAKKSTDGEAKPAAKAPAKAAAPAAKSSVEKKAAAPVKKASEGAKSAEAKKAPAKRTAAKKPTANKIAPKKPAGAKAGSPPPAVPRPGGVLDLRASAPSRAANGDD